MATITLKAGMVWKGAYDASATYDKLDVVRNADKTQIAVCKQGGSGIPLTNSNYWEVSIDASGIIALLEDALAHGEIYTMKIGSVTTGATSSATIVNNHQTHETILNLVLEKGEKGDKGDKGERGEKGDTTVIDPSTATAYTLYNQTGKHTDGAMTQDAVTKEFEKREETYARNDGYYESMGVGMATNLKGQNTVDAEFTYRKSGGNVEVQDGNAMIEAIKGNTIAWNQLATGTFYAQSATSNVTIENGVEATTTNKYIQERIEGVSQLLNSHVYVFCYWLKDVTNANTLRNSDFITINETGSVAQRVYYIPKNNDKNIFIFTSSANTTSCQLQVSNDIAEFSAKLTYPQLFDLTLIYGEGNEPSTPEQFEQDYFMWFGKPLTYEPYDAGSLRNTKVSALKTTGFNQWDEEWEIGYLGYAQNNMGQPIQNNNTLRSKNFIPVVSGATYYTSYINGSTRYIWLYDGGKNGIRHIALLNGKNTFTIPEGVKYIKFCTEPSYGTTYNHDICINLSDPNRNGEYEPYKESTLPLDVTTLTGKLNGEGSSVVVFADGMNSAGSVHDEIKIENGVVKAIKRVGKVDLGNLMWEIPQGRSSFRSIDTIYAQSLSDALIANIVCASFCADTATNAYLSKSNKIIGVQAKLQEGSKAYVSDSGYTDAATFKAAMNGVELCYELAEPEVYVLDDFNLPKLYPVANGGTEEQLSNSPNSLPATLSIRYGLNAAAFIQNAPKNYISKESMSNFLSNLGSAMGGTWSMTWNSSTNKYDFTFTQNRSVDVEQPIEDK